MNDLNALDRVLTTLGYEGERDLARPRNKVAMFLRVEVQRYILDELFKPTLGVSPPPEDPGGTGALATIGRAIMDIAGFFAFTYSLREVDRHELKTLTYDLHVADAERLTLSPQGTLHAAAGEDVDLAQAIRTVTPAAAAEMRFDIAPAVDLQNEDIEHIEFFLDYGSTEEHLLLDAQTPRTQQSVWYRPELGTGVRYKYEVHFGTAIPGSADIVRSEQQTTSARVIRLNPRELYQLVTVRVVPIGVPFDRYPLAIVDLKATDLATGWSTTTTLQIDAKHPESIFRMRASIDRLPRIERQIRYVDTSGVTTTLDWDTVPAGVLVVPNPLPDVLTLQILASARFGTTVRRLIVELRGVDDPASVASFILTADRPSDTWSRAVRDGASRDYQYRVTVHTVNSEVREGQWLVGPPGKLIVGESGEFGGYFVIKRERLGTAGASLEAHRRIVGEPERKQDRLLDPLVGRPCTADLFGDAQATGIELGNHASHGVTHRDGRALRRECRPGFPGGVNGLLEVGHDQAEWKRPDFTPAARENYMALNRWAKVRLTASFSSRPLSAITGSPRQSRSTRAIARRLTIAPR